MVNLFQYNYINNKPQNRAPLAVFFFSLVDFTQPKIVLLLIIMNVKIIIATLKLTLAKVLGIFWIFHFCLKLSFDIILLSVHYVLTF